MKVLVECVPVEDGYEVYAAIEDDERRNVNHLKDLVNRALGGTGVHVCMTRHGSTAHFMSSSFTPWTLDIANCVLHKISDCLPAFHVDTAFKKRKRQVRDALNKCTDSQKIERIAEILEI